MENRNILKQLIPLTIIILGAALMRIVPHIPNVTAITALALFSGATLRGWKSLGVNLKKLKKVFPADLLDILTRFNDVVYVPAKHEMDVEEDRPHLFSSKEAVFVCFIAKSIENGFNFVSEIVID
jgi:hypothetical protein